MFGIGQQRAIVLVIDDEQSTIETYLEVFEDNGLDSVGRQGPGAAPEKGYAPRGLAAQDWKPRFELICARDLAQAMTLFRELQKRGTLPVMCFVGAQVSSTSDGLDTVEALWRIDPTLHIALCVRPEEVADRAIEERLGQSDRVIILRKPQCHLEIRQAARMFAARSAIELQERRKRSELGAWIERSNVLLERVCDFVYERDLENRMVYVSAGFSRVTGLAPEKWELLFPTLVANARQLVGEAGSPIVQLPDVEGRTRYFELCEREITRTTIVGGARDVTRQEVLAAELRRAQKQEALGRLAGGIAHDFNNLMTVIAGHVELLRHDTPSDEIENILEATRQASELTRRLMLVSRDTPSVFELVDVSQLVREACRMFGRLIPFNVELHLALSEVGKVMVSPSELVRVLMNLVINATDAMPRGGDLRIETCSSRDLEHYKAREPGVVVVVADNGIGMTPDVAARIFDPFFTTKGVGRGTGLGLSVVMGVVEQASGSIRVESEPGQGSRFELYIPLASQEVVGGCSPSQIGRSVHERVLVVDNNSGVADMTAAVLRRAGYQVHVTTHASCALEMLSRAQSYYHLLITSEELSGMTGQSLFETGRKKKPGLRALYTRSKGALASRASVPRGNEEAVLAKPWTAPELLAAVRRVLGDSLNSVGAASALA